MTSTQIRLEETDQEVRVHIAGACSLDVFDTLLEVLRDCEPAGRWLVVDLREASSVDTQGIGVLLVARDYKDFAGAILRNPSPELVRTIHMLHLGTLFEIE